MLLSQSNCMNVQSQKGSPGLAKWNWKRDAEERVKGVALFLTVGACQ